MYGIPAIHFRKNQVIIREGEPSNSIFLITSGKVRITKNTGGKEPVLLATQGKNTIFGEMTLIDGKRRSASVTAIEDTYCYQCDAVTLIKQLNKIDVDLLIALKSLVALIRKNNEKLAGGVSELDISETPANKEDKQLMTIEQIKSPEMQDKIEELGSPFIKSLFRILTRTATKKYR